MIRPLALMCAAGLMAQAATTLADDPSNCQSCKTGSAHASAWMPAGTIVYADCDDSPGYCSLCASKGWPDKGWNPPAHYPVNRDGIWYRNWQPQAWYGSPGGGFTANSPMVYRAHRHHSARFFVRKSPDVAVYPDDTADTVSGSLPRPRLCSPSKCRQVT